MFGSVLLGHWFRSESSALCRESRLCPVSLCWAKLDCEGHGTPLISNLLPESFANLSWFSFRTETSSVMFLTFPAKIRPYKPPFAQTMVLTPSMPALRRQTVSLVYSVSSGLAKATRRNSVPKNQTENKNCLCICIFILVIDTWFCSLGQEGDIPALWWDQRSSICFSSAL